MSKNFHVGMHSDVYKWIRFKLDLMIDTIVLYTLMLVFLILILIQGHKSVRKQNVCTNYLTKLSIDLNGIWHTVRLVGVMNLILILS